MFQKLREAALAYHLERQWYKDKILTEYLNDDLLRRGRVRDRGCRADLLRLQPPGLRRGRRCAHVRLAAPAWEAALLAGMISSPSAYSPRNYPENATARRNQVLANMSEQGYITPEEYTKYAAIPIPDGKEIPLPTEDSAAPYFTTWLRQQLVDRYGAGEAFGGGLQIKSSLDLEFQERVQEITASTLAGIAPTASRRSCSTTRPAGVLAMVGGSDYQEFPFNLATNGQRQPGSSFKPFTLVTALEQGHSTGEVFGSAPQEIPFRSRSRRTTATERRSSTTSSESPTTTTTTSARPRSPPRPPTPTTPSTRSSGPRWASRTSPRRRTRWASTPTSARPRA